MKRALAVSLALVAGITACAGDDAGSAAADRAEQGPATSTSATSDSAGGVETGVGAHAGPGRTVPATHDANGPGPTHIPLFYEPPF